MSAFNAYGRPTIAGLLGSASFLTLKYGISAPEMFMFSNWLIPAGLAVCATIGAQIALPFQRTIQDELQWVSEGSGLTLDEVADIIDAAQGQIATMRRLNADIDDPVHSKVRDICNVADRIIDGFIDDPEDIKRSKTFLKQYLGETVDLVERYVDLSSKQTSSEKVAEVKAKFEEVLDEIETAFEKQYERNLSDDVLNFDVNLDVLKTSLKSEGF